MINLIYRILILYSVLHVNNLHAQLPYAESILSKDFKTFTSYGPDINKGLTTEIKNNGTDFSYLEVNTFNKLSGNRINGIEAPITSNLKKGDILWVSFKSRCLVSKRETGEGFIELRLDNLVNGKAAWPAHVVRGVSIGKDWMETSFSFIIGKDVNAADAKFVIKFDSYEQQLQISSITLNNYKQTVNLKDLPRSKVRYEGDHPDALWRKDALQRIEKIRKGDLKIKVLQPNGRPLTNAKISISLKRNSFDWGTAINSAFILEQNNGDAKHYRDTLKKYFNQVVFENEMKWKSWTSQPASIRGENTKKANKWLRENGMGARGHVMVWPSWRLSPGLESLKNDTAALRRRIKEVIQDQTTKMKGEFSEWDVVNEPISNHDILDVLGKNEMVTWFKTAHRHAPDLKLFLNDFTLFHGKGVGSGSQKFYDNIAMLLKEGAPIDAIGEQGHIGGAPPAIPFVLERLDYFSKFNLPIKITEFDIRSIDDDFKANYIKDFMIAIYSHPSVTGFVQWGFWAGAHWFPEAALWDKDWTLRPHGKVYTELVNKTWTTNISTTTNALGEANTRGYCGEYEISVSHNGKDYKRYLKLDNSGNEILIKL
ncbi:endo-1,4-beta-xylanase [Pedobacter glucosidilyticus]|uniref:endo-1,4-beta-xylanase n=1 Tax=Pedobacter glucosidilyticus TaxID=1122941 RepID=UPI00047ECC99|nr:endo-1,4-beta-xylanase [Pedobacter glucosidilyticus]